MKNQFVIKLFVKLSNDNFSSVIALWSCHFFTSIDRQLKRGALLLFPAPFITHTFPIFCWVYRFLFLHQYQCTTFLLKNCAQENCRYEESISLKLENGVKSHSKDQLNVLLWIKAKRGNFKAEFTWLDLFVMCRDTKLKGFAPFWLFPSAQPP